MRTQLASSKPCSCLMSFSVVDNVPIALVACLGTCFASLFQQSPRSISTHLASSEPLLCFSQLLSQSCQLVSEALNLSGCLMSSSEGNLHVHSTLSSIHFKIECLRACPQNNKAENSFHGNVTFSSVSSHGYRHFSQDASCTLHKKLSQNHDKPAAGCGLQHHPGSVVLAAQCDLASQQVLAAAWQQCHCPLPIPRPAVAITWFVTIQLHCSRAASLAQNVPCHRMSQHALISAAQAAARGRPFL